MAGNGSKPTRREQRAVAQTVLDRRMRLQLVVFSLIFCITLLLTVYHLVADRVNPLWAVLGLVAGYAIGLALARTKVLGWNQDDAQVVGNMDLIGAGILVLYIGFVIFKDEIVEHWIADAEIVVVIGLAMTCGTMLGRVISTRRGIMGALNDAGFVRGEQG
jgi:hypothetical protein